MTAKTKLLALAAAGLLAAGCTATPAQPSPSPEQAQPTEPMTGTQAPIPPERRTPPPSTNSPAPEADNAAALAAIATAQSSVNGRAVDLEWDDNEWEVDVLVGDVVHDLRVSADGSQVVRTDDDPDTVDADDLTRINESTITMEQAIETALAERQGRLTDADLDEDEHEWDVEVDDQEIRVDSRTGEIKR